ncbi:hypothetical protein EMCRGX_G029250 [Ephydatia muelleri]
MFRRLVARQDFPSYAFSNTTSPELWLGTLGIAPNLFSNLHPVYEVRSHIHAGQELGVVRSELQQSEDVLFHWSLIAATWDDEVAAKLMTMIVELWVTVRGFSLASAWIEQYKGATKKTLQKAKPLRKQI